jgi:hypothetical protein
LSNITLIKKINAGFLALILIVGTFAAISPSFMIGAHAQLYGMDQKHNSYESDYGMDNSYDDKQSYGKDNSYDKSKDSSSVSVKNIECNNVNVNNNGFKGVEASTLPTALNGLAIDDEAQASAEEGEVGASSSGSNDGDGRPSGSDSDSKVVCIQNNNNVVEEPTTAKLTVTKTTICEFGDFCGFSPLITVTGTDPTPNSFPAPYTPVVVTLGAGAYSVSEEGYTPGLAQCAGFDGGQNSFLNVYTCTNFSDDCSGDIDVGEELTCNIENTITESRAP